MVRVKICGITRQEDADAAVESGADALGFIFSPESPRNISLQAAKSIIQSLPPFITPVGVFVNRPRSLMEDFAATTGLRALQLHGDESPEETRGFTLPVYKAFRVGPGFELEALQRYSPSAFLLDTVASDLFGGTGKTFDWQVAVESKKYGRVILSGGLYPGNIVAAVHTVVPYAIDVNSGVESAPGIKDRSKIRNLFEQVRIAEEALCSS